MILATPQGDKFASFDSSLPVPRASQWGGAMSWAGRRVGLEDAAGLPAFHRALRLLSETPAGFPVSVYRGYDADREPVQNAPQLKVLRKPSPDHNPFQVWEYVFKSLCCGNAYLWKVKSMGAVEHLFPLNPALVMPKYGPDGVVFEIRERPGGPVTMTVGKEQILHIPGILLSDPCVGVSIVAAHRHGLGTQIARQEFDARWVANDGKPGVVLKHEQGQTPEQRAQIRESFEARHGGPSNAGRPAMIWGGWSLEPFDLSLVDAQYIETQKYGVQDIGRMTGVPSSFLNDPEAPGKDSVEQDNMRLSQFGIKPWTDRLEHGLASDEDLFPNPEESVEFDHSELLRADIKTRFDAYRLARQGGWITGNEIRRKEGYPRMEGGDEIQQTPVGGAANPQTPQGDDQEQPEND